jgi:endoglucanase
MPRFLTSSLVTLALVGAASGTAFVATSSASEPARTSPGTALAASWRGPLSTEGRYVVDADGNRFKLKSGNWHGASGTWNGSGDILDAVNHHAGEKSDQVPLGLDRAPIREILDSFHELGINSIRLPFSNAMVRDQRPVPDSGVAANPQLRGKTPLEVYDAVVAALTADGFAVILNNHTNLARWCCGLDGSERWNSSQSAQRWEEDWLFMARRYRQNSRVVGADLYNEVRRSLLDDPNWGLGDNHDWHAASQRAGDRILREANPDLLIIIEGINWIGLPIDGFTHGRPTLEPARTLSHTLVRSNKLVYSAHFYGYTGEHHSGATGLGETTDARYQDLTRDELFQVLDRQAFFVASQPDQHFTAPVWISEFGVGGRDNDDPKAQAWFGNFVDYLISRDADFAYWPLVGFHEGKRGNGWALMHWNAAGERIGVNDGDDWRADAWRRLIASDGKAGRVERAARYSMLTLDHGDLSQSSRLTEDWDSGARKASCPDGQRLIGLSHTGNRGLCTGKSGSPSGDHEVVRDERHVTTDWAHGYTKFQCAAGAALIGYSVRGPNLSSALCAPADGASIASGRTVWFDRGDNRPAGAKGGDFAAGHYKGQCADDEYAAGIAWTNRFGRPFKRPDALLCRPLTKG